MLVVDILHEFELGVWKALFIHLLRILEATNPALLHELDRRYACSLRTITFITHCAIATGKSRHLVETRFGNFGQTFLN
jgi:hypothetical protein